MSFDQERIAAANQAYIDALDASISVTLNGVSRLTALNLHTSQSLLADLEKKFKALNEVRDLQQLQGLQTALWQPAADRTAAYLRSLHEISRELREQSEKLAQTRFADLQQHGGELLEQLSGFAPAGSGAVLAGVRSILDAANSAFGNLNRAARQASVLADGTLARAEDAARDALGTASSAKKKAA